MSDFDAAWKEAFERHFAGLLWLLFPDVAEQIDWSQEIESLEAETRGLAPEGEGGKRLADKIFRVKLLRRFGGDDRYMHAEVQAQVQGGFERRVYVCNYRGDDRHGLPPEALVVLADDDPEWRPTTYQVKLVRTTLTFEFRPTKLLDWVARKDELRTHENVMALFVLAHLEALRTRGDGGERARVKEGLYRSLLDRKVGEEMYHWHRYLAWLLPLPEAMERGVFERTKQYAEANKMAFVTFPEKYAREQGMEAGLEAGLEQGERKGLLAGLRIALKLRFQDAGLALMPALERIAEKDRLAAILTAVETVADLEALRRLLPTP